MPTHGLLAPGTHGSSTVTWLSRASVAGRVYWMGTVSPSKGEPQRAPLAACGHEGCLRQLHVTMDRLPLPPMGAAFTMCVLAAACEDRPVILDEAMAGRP